MTWIPTLSGLPVDLVHPRAVEVDFAEIAHALAHVNRFAGNSREPVSVALHTLIGLDFCATATLKAKWLLHDAHEARLGDLTSPCKEALHAVALDVWGHTVAEAVANARKVLETRHDKAVFEAAGLPMPDPIEGHALKLVDLRALATERRDFLTRGPAPRPWGLTAMGIEPGPRVWRWSPPDRIAERLLAEFRTFLPALQRGRRAS